MLGIRTSTLRPEVALSFDVYLLISGKHLLYVRRSDSLERFRLQRLNERNVDRVYIDEADKAAYERFLDESARHAIERNGLSPLERATIIGAQSVAAVEEFFSDPDSRERYERVRAAAANQVATLLRHPATLEQLLTIAKTDAELYRHSVNVAALAVGLAAAVGAPAETCDVLGLGGLLHDLGKVARAGAPAADIDERQHPRLGAGALLGKSYVSRDVLDVILLHEERIDGKGYPAGVRKLDQIFQVVGLANMYDRAVTLEGRAPAEAYRQLSELKPAPYDARLIAALRDVLKASNVAV